MFLIKCNVIKSWLVFYTNFLLCLQMRGEVMNIKILETKLQTIFENNLFAVTEENIKERILIEQDI